MLILKRVNATGNLYWFYMTKLTQRIGLPRYEADEHYKLALAAYQKNDYDQAIDQITKAIDLLPRQPEYHAARGLFYLRDGITDKAQEEFDEALRIFGFEMLAHYGLGVIAYKAKQWQEARQHFTAALAAQPERAETLYYMALVQHRLRNNAEALSYMRQAAVLFEQANDRSRRSDANKWVKTFEDLVAKATTSSQS